MNLLLVEDNDNDAELMRIAIQRAGVPVNICHAREGREALSFMLKEDDFPNAPDVDLVLVDLNMPGMNGRELIETMKRDERLAHLPIVVISSSTADSDILDTYRLGASSYLAKPVQFDVFQQAVNSLINYWFKIVQLPTGAAAAARAPRARTAAAS